jgi:hypothetical protein
MQAATRLRTLQPGVAHNVHMPSHIDIRCGRWHEAVEANLRAIAADQRYRKITGRPSGSLMFMSRTTVTCWRMRR